MGNRRLKPNDCTDPTSSAVVSLTSFGERLKTLPLTIKSILAGTTKPRRLVLWVTDAERSLVSPDVLAFCSRGLEVRFCPDYGPHKKYILTLGELEGSDILVTADDDVLYPKKWLSTLIAAREESPECVVAFRAKRMLFDHGRIAPYATWPMVRSAVPSLAHVSTGVSGVAFPKALVSGLLEVGLGFTEKAPRADDLWIHSVAVSNGIMTRQVRSRPREFFEVPGTRSTSLMRTNVGGGGNDAQILSTYSDELVSRIERSLNGAD